MNKRLTIAQQVFINIQEDIIKGNIKDGEIITERSLEQRYQVSRTPIKEALKLLESEGWVEITPRYETRVTCFGTAEISETLPIRIAMEGLAVKLCIQNMNEAKKNDFIDLLTKLDGLRCKIEESDPDCLAAYNKLDNKFHTMICRYSDNRILINFNTKLSSMFKRIYRNIMLDSMRIKTGSEEVMAIIRYILENDAMMAEAAMTLHIINSINQKLYALGEKK
ncbi:MAG: GntR family transcriptional regulator [Clostridiaceae bacterium]|jgi:DNA-binding GntR family transcriptional regulator|nr:GntR family transcriptional regulator [Clostridiaceae bacterium]